MHPLTLLLPALALAESLYTKSSPVLQLDASTYSSVIKQSNYTSIVEFYAPWCGHCRNLAPAYQKAATSLAGLANVAAINCDDDANKQFCGSMGVQGFPTLKIVKPGKKTSGKKARSVVTDYQGPRTAKGIVDAVKDKMPNHVTRVKDDNVDAWRAQKAGPKALIVGDKGLVPPLAKAVAIDFLGALEVGYARAADTKVAKAFGVDKVPAVLLLPEEGGQIVRFDGEVKKDALVAFLGQAAQPNPEAKRAAAAAAGGGAKKEKTEKKKQKSKAKAKQTAKKSGNKGDRAAADEL